MWTQEVKDKLGIDVKYDWTTDDTQYKTKLNVTIASGDIPDFFVAPSDVLMQLAKNGKLADIGDVYEKFASNDLKATRDAFPEGFESAKIDGKLMALSDQGYGLISMPNVVWIRDDWMKKLNLSAPKSMSDLIKMAETFTAEKPDGQKDTYGISVTKGLYGSINSITGIANGYHAYPQIWVKDASGKIAYGSIQPEMKKLLGDMQGWFDKGILSKEFGVKDTNKVNEDIVSGKVGIMFGANWGGMFPIADLVKKDPNKIFKPYAIPSADDKQVMLQSTWPVNSYYVISKACKNPEAVIKMANLYNKYSYHSSSDIKQKFIVSANAEEYFTLSPVYTTDPTVDYNAHVNISDAINKKDGSKLSDNEKEKYDLAIKWAEKKDPAGYGAYYQISSEGAYGVLKKFVDNKQVLLTAIHGADTPIYAQKKATLDKMELDTFTKIIMGAAPISEFDKFVDNWNNLGGKDATKEVNDTYGK
jgi:putative aldouronate transport system substrate-binding protein